MYIQGNDNVLDLAFNNHGVTYGDVFLENEKQMSEWHFRSPIPMACSRRSKWQWRGQ